jgi:phosphoribosyl 1,2-cyclic phosphate phosphodiesterase
MKLVILGSGAAEAIPNPFCRCAVCETARQEGGPEIRGRAAALLNDDLLIDLGPDIVSSAIRFNLYLGNLSTVLITHRHSDHWLPSNLHWREPGFAATPVVPLTLYGPEDALRDVQPYLDRATDLSAVPVKAGQRWTAGSYQITAVPATHGDGKLEALLYVVDDGTHRLFYATDTSTLTQEAWDILRSLGPLDLILLDATAGLGDGGGGHHGFEKFIQTRARMRQEGLLGDRTRLVAHHFSHNGNLTHTELAQKFAPFGVTVSYDGLEWTL